MPKNDHGNLEDAAARPWHWANMANHVWVSGWVISTNMDTVWYCNIWYVYTRIYVRLHPFPLHFIALYCISLHCSVFYCIALHFIPFSCIALHFIAFHCIALQFVAFHCIVLHFIALHCISFDLIALQYTTLHDITLQHITWHYITLRYITLLYIQIELNTLAKSSHSHTYIHIYVCIPYAYILVIILPFQPLLVAAQVRVASPVCSASCHLHQGPSGDSLVNGENHPRGGHWTWSKMFSRWWFDIHF